jgi:pyruvate dehydrogenase E1 component beta subunit
MIASGPPVDECLAIAETWAQRGVDVEVVDLGIGDAGDETVVLASVGRTKNAVVVGDGAELACRIHEELFADLEHAVQRVGDGNNRGALDDALRRVLT